MQNLQAGFARLEITPPMGTYLSGYYFERKAEGVLDPLYVLAAAFRCEDTAAVILTCDVCQVHTDVAMEWTVQIARKLEIPPEAVLLHSTHTHTGPVLKGETLYPSDPQYDAWLLRRLCDAAALAMADCRTVREVCAYEGLCPGVTYPRRLRMRDGHVQTWGVTKDPGIAGFACEGDDSLRLVRIRRETGGDLVLVNFQSHPDHVSGNLISADFPGFLRDKVETERPGTKCMFLNGAQGQLIVHEYIRGTIDLPKYVRSQWAGRTLAEFVLSHLDQAAPVEGEGIAFGRELVCCRTKRDPSRMEWAQWVLSVHENGTEEAELGPDWVATPQVAEANILRNLEQEKLDEVSVPVSVLTVGGMAFVGFAGEPFCELGRLVRERSPFPVTMVCCITNGSEGYYPTAEAYDQGGYEPAGCRFPKGIGEKLAEVGLDILRNLS